MENQVLVNDSILKDMPTFVKAELPKMSAEKQASFIEEFNRKKKSVGLAYFFTILCLGIPYGYLGKWGMQLVYWLTGGGILIWFIILLFKLPDMVKDYNKDIATQIMRDIKIMG